MNRHFSKDEVQMVSRHMKTMLKCISHQEHANKTTAWSNLIPVRMATIRKSTINAGEDMEKVLWSTVGENVSLYSHYGGQCGES